MTIAAVRSFRAVLVLLFFSVIANAQFSVPPLPLPDSIGTDPFNANSQVGYCLSQAGSNSCTANDFSITDIAIVNVIDGCSAPDDYMKVDMDVTFSKTQPTRYEVGAWFYRGAVSGADFNTGDAVAGDFCTRIGIAAGLVTNGGITADIDGDGCVDVPGNSGPIEPERFNGFVLPCRDINDANNGLVVDGIVDISACTSWGNNIGQLCNTQQYQEFDLTWPNSPFAGEIVPGTGSKCGCSEFNGDPITVSIPDISVTKSCTPTELAPGDTTTCTIEIINSGNGAMEGATADNTPGFFYEDNYPESQGSVVGATISTTQGSAVLGFVSDSIGADTADESLNIYPGDIPASTTVTITYDFQTSASLPSTITTITNTVCASYYNESPEVLSYATDADMCAQAQVTTPVTLVRFEAGRNKSSGLMEFHWATAAESGNLGFNLYAKMGKTQYKINPQLIPSKVTDSKTTTHYQYSFDAGKLGPVTEFYIEDVDILGRPSRHGAFALGSHGQSQEKLAANPTAWKSIGDHVQKRSRELTRKNATASKNSGQWVVDIAVSESGIQRVPFQALAGMGVPAGLSASEYVITQGGAAVPVYFGELGSRDSVEAGSYLEFVGEVSPTLYSDQSHYTLHIATGQPGETMNEVAANPRGRDITDYYAETLVQGQDLRYSPTSPALDDPWYDTRILAIHQAAQSTYNFALTDVANASLPTTLTARYWGGLDFPDDSDDHHVQWHVNGTTVLNDQFDGIVAREQTASVALNPNASAVTVSAYVPADTPRGIDLIHVDEVALTYPRYTRVIANQLDFQSNASNLAVSNLTGEVVIYAKSATETIRLKKFKEQSGRVEFANVLGGDVRFFVSGSDQVNSPQLALVPGLDISTINAADLVITHDVFLGSTLDAYAEQRSSNSATVPVSAIYAAYSDGNVTPDAIQSFIRDVATRRGGTLNSVLLVGGDTYDYHDNLGLGSISFVPTLYRTTDSLVNFSAVDAMYGDLNGDGIPEVAVGRLPVRTVSELATVISKQQQFASRSNQHAVLAADDSEPGAAYNFGDNSEVLGQMLQGAGWSIDRTYLDELSPAAANAQLVSQLNAGPKLAVFTGHSAMKYWSFNGLFSAYDAAGLTNHGNPFAVLQWGCWNTYFVEPREDSLGHMFMLNGDQGAAAVMGASTLTNADRENEFAQFFQDALLAPNATLGSAMSTAKAQYAAQYGYSHRDILWGISLLGDPLLTL
jgi:hypothetical protein